MNAWNLEVANRLKKKLDDGDESIVLINRKSIQQLQEHYDRVEAKLASSRRTEVEVLTEATHEVELNDTLRENRRTLPPLPPVTMAQSTTYQQDGSSMPLGNPTVMNSEIVAGSLLPKPTTEQNPVPFQMIQPTPQIERNPLDGFKRYTWCITCGYQKGAHQPGE
jgi:hypothetical protein